MLKKYLPYIMLIAAALLLYWVRSHRRGAVEKITVPAITENASPDVINNDLPFYRDTTQLVFSRHARCRMDCRHVDESEVKEVLLHGSLNESKIEESDKGKTYPLEDVTADQQHVRLVIAPHNKQLVVVTVIDLDTEWPCDCK